MSGKLITATPSATVLVEEIIDRYGSIGAFCDLLRRDLDDPTIELPRLSAGPRVTGSTGTPEAYLAWSQAEAEQPRSIDVTTSTVTQLASTAADGAEPGAASAPEPPEATSEPETRRSLWRRLLAWF